MAASVQCQMCGGPLRGRPACAYCGTPAPAEAPANQGPATCICGILASTRCRACDRAVCDLHADSIWRTQSGAPPLHDATERAVWDWATTLPPALMFGTEHQSPSTACTSCRAVNGELAVTRWRDVPRDADPLMQMIYAFKGGICADVVPTSVLEAYDPMAHTDRYRAFIHESFPTTQVALKWKYKWKGELRLNPVKTTPGHVVFLWCNFGADGVPMGAYTWLVEANGAFFATDWQQFSVRMDNGVAFVLPKDVENGTARFKSDSRQLATDPKAFWIPVFHEFDASSTSAQFRSVLIRSGTVQGLAETPTVTLGEYTAAGSMTDDGTIMPTYSLPLDL